MRIPRLVLPLAAALVAGVGLVPVLSPEPAQADVRTDCWQTNEQYVTVLSRVALNRDWGAEPIAQTVAELDSRAHGAARAAYAKTNLVEILFHSPEYAGRNRSNAQIVRDVVQGVVHRAPVQRDYDATLVHLRGQTTVAAKVARVMAVVGAEADTKLTKLCTAAEAGTTPPPAYDPGGDVDANRCWQTTDQFVATAGRIARVGPWDAASAARVMNGWAFGAERARQVRITFLRYAFRGAYYTDRGRTNTQMVRDVIEAAAHRAPTQAEFDTLTPRLDAVTTGTTVEKAEAKLRIVLEEIRAEAEPKWSRICSPAEADPEPPAYVPGSDVTPDGRYFNPLDTVDVKFRSEVRVLKNTDAAMTGLEFWGEEPVLRSTFNVRGTTAAGRATVTDIQIGTRLAAQPPVRAGRTVAVSSVMIEVDFIEERAGGVRRVAGKVLQLPELIRSGSVDLTSAVNAGIPAAVQRVMDDTTRAHARADVGSFYGHDARPLTPDQARPRPLTPGQARPGVTTGPATPAVWTSPAPEGGICLNAVNLSMVAGMAASEKENVGYDNAFKRRADALKDVNGVLIPDVRLDANATAKINDAQACITLQASNWTVSNLKLAGQIRMSTSARINYTLQANVNGTVEVTIPWKLAEKDIYIPIPVATTGIVIPSSFKPGVYAPLTASLAGNANFTHQSGTAITGQVTTTTVDTSAADRFTQVSIPGTRTPHGTQLNQGSGRVTGTIKMPIAPTAAFAIANFGKSATLEEQLDAVVTLPPWFANNPLSEGLLKITKSLTIPEVSLALAVNTAPTCTVTYTPTITLRLDDKLTIAEGAFKAIGWPPPTVTLSIPIFTLTTPPEVLWTLEGDDCVEPTPTPPPTPPTTPGPGPGPGPGVCQPIITTSDDAMTPTISTVPGCTWPTGTGTDAQRGWWKFVFATTESTGPNRRCVNYFRVVRGGPITITATSVPRPPGYTQVTHDAYEGGRLVDFWHALEILPPSSQEGAFRWTRFLTNATWLSVRDPADPAGCTPPRP